MTSLQDIQKMFAKIYGKRNKQLYKPADLLLHVFEETSFVAESFRKEDEDGVPGAVARLFGWLMAFCNMERIDFAKAVFGKYHGACPYCGKSRHCVCISAETKPGKWLVGKRKMPQTFLEWQKMFLDIYGRVNKVAGREKCWMHVLEELGEVSKASRLNQKQALKDEIADAFAWIVAFCNNLNLDLERVILAEYPFKCDACKQIICECPKV